MSMPQNFMESLIAWVDDNLERPLRIDDVAKQSGYSKWYLQRMFTGWLGKSLGAYIRERKLQLAAKDLKNTTDKILDISVRYGFDSQQSFTRTFSKQFNTSPGAYRRTKYKLIVPRLD